MQKVLQEIESLTQNALELENLKISTENEILMIEEDIRAGDFKKQELLFSKEELENVVEGMTNEYG